MSSVTRGAMLRVPKALLRDIDNVMAELTIENGAYWSAANSGASTKGIPQHIEMYREDDTYLYVPRHYKPAYTKTPFKLAKRVKEREFDITSKVTLRDDIQREASEALLANENDKVLALACGRGKTVVSLDSAARGGRFPILVVVHTNALVGQWKKAISKFYGIPESEIGHIQQGRCEWKGKAIAVAMLHTLVARDYDREFYDYWRLVIYDEAHRLGAAHFAKAAPMFLGERWGLSATHKRDDGNDVLFKLHLGDVCYENLEQDLNPQTYFVNTGIAVGLQKYMFRGKVKYAQLLTDLSKNEDRNQLILRYMNEALAKGRTVLVLGERVQQLYDLCEACEIDSKAVHVGSMKEAERNLALTKRAVFATQQLAKEGLDRPAFDTLFVLFPFGGDGRLKQSWGRILRTDSEKRDPKVVVFFDPDWQFAFDRHKRKQVKKDGMIMALSYKMQRNLKAAGWAYKIINPRKAA